jgi:hypothetical protein
MSFSSSPIKCLVALAAALAPAALMTGCANMVTTASDTNAFSVAGTMNGKLYGGNQPVSGSTVKLYAVGTTGYGSPGTLLATTTSANDGYGSFSFSQVTSGATGPSGSAYICPSSNSLLYIIASGGNTIGTGSNNNTAAVFLAAVGPCGTAASVFLDVNEVTTAASVAALAQYINPGSATPASASVGSPSSSQAITGITNAFSTIANMVNLAAGTSLTSSTVTASGANVPTATVTITPESAKINTIANILSACVNNANSSGGGCTTLFTNATPPSPAVTSQPSATFATAVDTLQAAYYMATNPTDGGATALGNLYALGTATAPFQPTLAAQPTDWTIAITYSAPTATSVCTSGAPFINYGYQISVDAVGNVWMANGGSSTNSAIAEISPTGKPLACTEVALLGVRGGAVIDTAGNVWATSNTAAAVYKFNGSTTATIVVPGTGAHSYAIGADGRGNVFFTDPVNLKLYELPSSATSATTPTLIGPVTGASPFAMGIDTKNTVVVGQSGSGGSTITAYPTTTVGGTTYPSTGTSLTQTGDYAGVYGIAFDASGGFWVGNSAGTSASAGTGPGNTTSLSPVSYASSNPGDANVVTFGTPANLTPIFSGGLSTARQVAIDGAGNVWTPDNTAASSGLFAVTELTKTGVALSPTSTTGTTTVTQNGGFQKAVTVLSGPRGIAVDPSGNVWVSNTGSTTNNWVTEIVGAAVPAVTPLSAALAASKLGVTP